MRTGKPFSLIDEKLQTEWTIHPFAWQLKQGAKSITFDWEHTEYHFIKPEEIQQYDHVPQLEIGMQRVLVSPRLEKDLAILRDDHESGAQALTSKALNMLLAAVERDLSHISNSKDFWRELRWTAWHLAKNGRPSMGAAIETELFKALDHIVRNFQPTDVTDLQQPNFVKFTNAAIKHRFIEMEWNLDSVGDNLLALVSSLESENTSPDLNIVTLSSSGTVTRSLEMLVTNTSRNIKITVLESRPGFEGVAFVNTLLGYLKDFPNVLAKLKIEIVSDASITTVLKDADFLVFGGDKVLPNGNVSNKIGTLSTAMLAEELNPGCKVLALITTNKIIGSGLEAEHLKVEYNAAAELTAAWPATYLEQLETSRKLGFNVDIKNAYFEWVPSKYIDHYVSEKGLLEVEDILRLGEESKALQAKIFGDL